MAGRKKLRSSGRGYYVVFHRLSICGYAVHRHLQLTIMPCVAMIPFFLVIAVAIPYYQYRKMSRESIVERIRGE